MTVMALALLLPVLQGKHDLRWNPKVGQEFDMRCRVEDRFPDPANPRDVKTVVQEAKAVLTVRRNTPQEVTFDLKCTKYLLKGQVDNKLVDIHYENGVARQHGKEGPEGDWLKEACERTGSLAVTAKGKASMQEHILKSCFDGTRNVIALLPGDRIKGNGEFSNAVEFPPAGGRTWPAVMLNVKVSEASEIVARLAGSGRAESEVGSKTLDVHVKMELEFQVADGFCSKSRRVLNVFDKTKSSADPNLEAGLTLEWEMAPRK